MVISRGQGLASCLSFLPVRLPRTSVGGSNSDTSGISIAHRYEAQNVHFVRSICRSVKQEALHRYFEMNHRKLFDSIGVKRLPGVKKWHPVVFAILFILYRLLRWIVSKGNRRRSCLLTLVHPQTLRRVAQDCAHERWQTAVLKASRAVYTPE